MIDTLLAQATKKWEKHILRFISELYIGKWLPSHDIGHHKRVWTNAVEFCKLTTQNIWEKDKSFFEKLMICCYFHDVGLLTDTSEYHGKESRKICEKFLGKYSEQIKFDVEELLVAIENHDEKNYDYEIKNRNRLLEILALADDLDAFGAIGVYRYIEIYLLRGIQPKLIADRIIINAQHRFNNVKLVLSGNSFLIGQYNNKFLILKSILEPNKDYDDPEILINWINERIVKTKKDPFIISHLLNQKEVQTGRIADFIEKFHREVQNIFGL
jgi:HD superfamily phosphodiesterase